MQKIAPVIPLSHYPTDGEANLRFLGELTGRQNRVEAILAQYRQAVVAARQRLPQAVKDKQVVAIRIRAGNIAIFPANVFLNDILYTELGLPAPEEFKAAKAQEIISLERFSAMDPDYIFLQYAASESPSQANVLNELQRNPVWLSMKAVRNNRVFINVVDPLIQGVAVSGKLQFLNAAVEKLSQ
jgi:iron complex transport system substrate-binding protein